MTPTAFDTDRAETFNARMDGMVEQGAVAVMVSIGHRTGLFDTMATMPPPAMSAQVAAEAALAERYVREWLAVMVTAWIVDFGPPAQTYALPAEHAASLTRGAPFGNFAVYAQHVALLGAVQDRTLACFETGEGMRYADYPCFHQIMAEDSGTTVRDALFDHILPLVVGIEARLEVSIEVMDAGCGQGAALIALPERYPQSRFAFYDLETEAVDRATAAACRPGQRPVRGARPDRLPTSGTGRPDHLVRRDPRPEGPGGPDPRPSRRAAAGRRLPGARHRRLGAARSEPRLSYGAASLRDLVRALHADLARPGRRGTRHDVRLGDGRGDAARRRLRTRHILPHDPMNVWFVART